MSDPVDSPFAVGRNLVNAMTVDVEDYFQVALFEKYVAFSQWSSMECRVEANTERILALFQKHAIRGTFFILGWVAQRYPKLIRQIVAEGHEVASHGMYHIRATEQSPEIFFADVLQSKRLLEAVSGQPVRGYRASTYSIGANNLWALDMLHKAGYHYSSSIYPIYHDLYGMPAAPRFPFFPRKGVDPENNGILEIPITTVTLFNQRIPCGGGGYFRLFPPRLFRWALRRVNRKDGQSGVFYFHPWELDPEQPRIPGLPSVTRFRHYLNLHRMESRLADLLDAFRWDRVDQVFSYAINSEANLEYHHK